MNRDESKAHAQKNIDDLDKDETVLKMPDMDMNSLQGYCYRIALSGSDFNLDIVAPVQCIKDFDAFINCALYLSLFCRDDSVRDIVRKRILESLNNPEGVKE